MTSEEIKAQSEWAIKYNRCCDAVGGGDFVTCTEKIYATIVELRATKHALWMARAEAARKEISWWIDDNESYPTYMTCVLNDINLNSGKTMLPQEWIYLWMEIHRKCRQKAKEFE